MKIKFTCFMMMLALFLAMPMQAQRKNNNQRLKQIDKPVEVRNVIFMIGDGMGLAQAHALMLATGQRPVMFDAPVIGLISTDSYTHKITDSGAGGTALATGFKTRNGMIGMRPDSTAAPSLVDIFAHAGRRTGVAVTCDVTHATPDDFVA